MISNPVIPNIGNISSPASPPENLNEVNCQNSKAIYHYVRRLKPEKLKQLFRDLPAPYDKIDNIEAYLTDENNWVSAELISVLFKNAVDIFKDPGVPFHIGFDSIKSRNIGTLLSFMLTTFSSPRRVLKRLNQINQQFNTTKIIETVYLSRTRTVIRLHWKENRGLDKNVCLYNQGIYAAIPTMWGLPPQDVTETDCYFNDAPYCQYNITFQRRRFKNLIPSRRMKSRKASLLRAIEEIENDKILLKKKNDEVIKLNLELREKVDRLSAINAASSLLVSIVDTDEILKTTMKIIVDVLKFDRALLMLVDGNNEFLKYVHSTGAEQNEVDDKLKSYKIPLSRTSNILVRTTIDGIPVLVKDAREAGLNPNNLIIKDFSPNSIAFCPLNTAKGSIGILAADRTKSNRMITRKELEHLSIFVNTMAATLYKAKQDEELENSYLNTIKALVKAIEEKDQYTSGHSERVSRLSRRLAAAMDLPEDEVELIGAASLLHDVGKIGIPESIVRSPKPLTPAEYKIIKTHPEKGCEIIEPVRRLKEHSYLIRLHHERFDGKGYPDGIAGAKIPTGAQIIAVADTFDAITSSRAYRKGLPKEEAARRIQASSGSQFSPAVIEVFMKVFNSEILHDDSYLE